MSYIVFLSIIRRFFSFQCNIKELDPTRKTDLDIWHCLRIELLILYLIHIRHIFAVISGVKTRLISRFKYLQSQKYDSNVFLVLHFYNRVVAF